MSGDLPVLERLAAFTDDPRGGNPAGVYIGERLPAASEMQRIAREVGYSETAFVAAKGERRYDVRYYSPEAEVPFCGHATIATGVVLGRREGTGRFVLDTAAGEVQVVADGDADGFVASLTSVAPRHRRPEPELLDGVLACLGWSGIDLDPGIPPALAFAGAWHLVIAVSDSGTLSHLEYDFDRLKALMLAADLTTIQLIWRESDAVYHSRNPFPVGGVVEDPATGAAAAALGGYLRDAGLLHAPASFMIRQGETMGRPSRLNVTVPETGGITVSGAAVTLPGHLGGGPRDGGP